MSEHTCPYCQTKVGQHPATPCLSAWVAGVVMGWKLKWKTSEGNAAFSYIDPADSMEAIHEIGAFDPPGWNPHEDIAAAMEVLTTFHSWNLTPGWCRVWTDDHNGCHMTADTLPLAICRAAILAKKKEKP